MYVLLTKYQVNPIFEHEFRAAWISSCDALKDDGILFKASLFRESKITYLSQTYWPDALDYKELYSNPPIKFRAGFQKMEEYSNQIIFLHKMAVVHEHS